MNICDARPSPISCKDYIHRSAGTTTGSNARRKSFGQTWRSPAAPEESPLTSSWTWPKPPLPAKQIRFENRTRPNGRNGYQELAERFHSIWTRTRINSWQEIEEIIKGSKRLHSSPANRLFTPDWGRTIIKSLKSIVEPEFLSVVTRKPAVFSGGYPFQVEASVAYGGKAGRKVGEETRMEIMRFANRAPLLFDTGGCGITEAVKSVDWKRYGIKDAEVAPVTVFVNLISVHIPYTGAGKQVIANDEEIVEEIRLWWTPTKTARYIIGKERERLKMEKKRIYSKYAIEVAIALGELWIKDPKPIEHKLWHCCQTLEDWWSKKRIGSWIDAELEKEIARLGKWTRNPRAEGQRRRWKWRWGIMAGLSTKIKVIKTRSIGNRSHD